MKKHILGALFTALVLIISAGSQTACSTIPTASQVSATAEKFSNDALGYAQSLAVMFQTVNTAVQAATPVITSIAAEWGLNPTNSKQLAIYNTVVADMNKASGDVTKVNSLLSTANLQAVVATAS